MNQDILLASFLIVSYAVFGTTALENCSRFYSKHNVSGNYMAIKIEELYALKTSPLEFHFSYPILGIESNIVDAAKVNTLQWKLILKHETNSTYNESDPFINIIYNDEASTITEIKSTDILCSDKNDVADLNSTIDTTPVYSGAFDNTGDPSPDDDLQIQPKDIPACASQLGTLNFSSEQIFIRLAKWTTGRNYRIEVPSYETFVGYVVDLFFTKPVIGFTAEGANVTKFSPIHWALTKEFTQRSCVKLNEIFFSISYEEETDVESLIFNGKPLIGHGQSLAVFRNKNINNAMATTCEKYFATVSTWFGEEKGKSINFTAPNDSDEAMIGIVVEFIFEKNIAILKIWDLTLEMISSNHWKIYNSGIVVPPKGNIRLNFISLFHDNFHVKIKGVKLNGRVLCGLGSTIYLNNDKKSYSHLEVIEKNNKAVREFYGPLLVVVIFVSMSMVIAAVVVSSLIFKKWMLKHEQKKHLFDFPPKELPLELANENTSIPSVENSVYSEESNISHM